jgi:hypothetical protein
MAITSVGSAFVGNNKSSSTSYVVAAGTAIAAGRLVVVSIVKDNAAGADSDAIGSATEEFTNCTDAQGNTWTKLLEARSGSGGGNNSVSMAVYASILTTALGSTDNLTVTLSDSRVAKVSTGWVYNIGTANAVTMFGKQVNVGTGTTNAIAASTPTGTAGDNVYLRFGGQENTAGNSAPATWPTGTNTAVTASGTTGSPVASNQNVIGEFNVSGASSHSFAAGTWGSTAHSVVVAFGIAATVAGGGGYTLEVTPFSGASTFPAVGLLAHRRLDVSPFSSVSTFSDVGLVRARKLDVTPFSGASTFGDVGKTHHRRLNVTPPFTGNSLFPQVNLNHLRQYTLGVNSFSGNSSFRDIIISKSQQIIDRISVVKVKHGEPGLQGPAGIAGAHGLAFHLTNEAHTVPTNTDGSGGNYTGAGGSVKVYSGIVDVTSSSTFGAASWKSGGGTFSYVAGTYAVSNLTSDVGVLNLPVTYAGVTFVLEFTVTKSKQGVVGTAGAAGADAKTLQLSSDRQIITDSVALIPYGIGAVFGPDSIGTTGGAETIDTSGVRSAEGLTYPYLAFTVAKTTSRFNAGFYNPSGVQIGSWHWVTSGLYAFTGSAYVFITATLNVGDRLELWLSDGGTLYWFRNGVLAHNVGKSAVGLTTLNFGLETSTSAPIATNITFNTSEAQGTTFTATKVNTTAAVTWSVTRLDGTVVASPFPDGMPVLSGSGDSRAMSVIQYHRARGATAGVIVTASLTDGGTLTDRISVVRLNRGTPGATGSPGPALFTLATHGTGAAIFSPNSAGKSGGASGWDAGVYSAQSYSRAFLSFKSSGYRHFMMGLTTNPTASAHFNTIDFAWLVTDATTCAIHESGADRGSFGSYDSSTVFSITYDGQQVRYFKNGVVQRTVPRASTTPLYLDSSFYLVQADAQAVDIAFGPMGEQGPALFTLATHGTDAHVFSPNSFGRAGSSWGWNSGVYSLEGYTRGAFLSFRPGSANLLLMAGLTSTPLASSSYEQIDYAWYLSNTSLMIIELGGFIGIAGTYDESTRFAITYDGVNVRYWKDGEVIRTVARSIGLPLYLDSSIFYSYAFPQVRDIAFGPMGEQGPDATTVIARTESVASVGGYLITGSRPATTLYNDLTNVATFIQTNENSILNGDILLFRKNVNGAVQTEYMRAVSTPSGSGPYTYAVTRNLDGSGADVWKEGDVVTNLGQAGDHFIEQYSKNGLKGAGFPGPTMVGNRRGSITWNDWAPRWAIGNLNGLFGYNTNIHGFAAGDPAGPWIKVDPTNGVRIGHNATTRIALDAAGNASFTGQITAASGTIGSWVIDTGLRSSSGVVQVLPNRISIGSGTHAYAAAGTSFWASEDGKFSLGTKFRWDGANLSVVNASYIGLGAYALNSNGLVRFQGYIQDDGGGEPIPSAVGGIDFPSSGFMQVSCNIVANGGIFLNGSRILSNQQAAIPNTSGATLATLEAEVNKLKAMNRAHGLIAT